MRRAGQCDLRVPRDLP